MNTIISDADLRAIEKAAPKNSVYFGFLQKLMQKKKVVSHKDLSQQTVRLNSLVLIWHSVLKKIMKIRIVLPGEDDIKQNKISVFAPISMAIFGHRENERLLLPSAGIQKELRIIKVYSN